MGRGCSDSIQLLENGLNYTDEERAEAAERQRKAIVLWCK